MVQFATCGARLKVSDFAAAFFTTFLSFVQPPKMTVEHTIVKVTQSTAVLRFFDRRDESPINTSAPGRANNVLGFFFASESRFVSCVVRKIFKPSNSSGPKLNFCL